MNESGTELIIFPILSGALLGLWSLVFVRDRQPEQRNFLFIGILLPSVLCGYLAAGTFTWYWPDHFEGFSGRRIFAEAGGLSFFAAITSAILLPVFAMSSRMVALAVSKLHKWQFNLAFLSGILLVSGPFVFVTYFAAHSPVAVGYVGLQYVVFGLLLWRFVQPVPPEEESSGQENQARDHIH